MLSKLDEKAWDLLLPRIKEGKCTPFLGAGACVGTLPLAADIARVWAQKYAYPFPDTGNLARVAQYLAVLYDPMFPKEAILRQFFEDAVPPDFTDPIKPELHFVLADLPLPIYMTTNYDDFMLQALQKRKKSPARELCCWNKLLEERKKRSSIFDSNPHFEPTPEQPLIFHLHGHDGVPESLVLTEDDYLDFLVNTSRKLKLLPHQISRALSGSSLLFIGYSLEDWTFRVLFRGLVSSTEPSLRRISVTVQLQPPELVGEVHLRGGDKITGKIGEETEECITVESPVIGVVSLDKKFVERVAAKEENAKEIREKQQEFLRKYFDDKDIRVYWGTAQEFAAELKERWEKYSHGI